MPRYPHNPADGVSITLDDLAAFVAEMMGYRNLPGTTVVRGQGHIEFDMLSGPRLRQLTADTDVPAPNRETRRAHGHRGPHSP